MSRRWSVRNRTLATFTALIFQTEYAPSPATIDFETFPGWESEGSPFYLFMTATRAEYCGVERPDCDDVSDPGPKFLYRDFVYGGFGVSRVPGVEWW